jgi:hypothetical protein
VRDRRRVAGRDGRKEFLRGAVLAGTAIIGSRRKGIKNRQDWQ